MMKRGRRIKLALGPVYRDESVREGLGFFCAPSGFFGYFAKALCAPWAAVAVRTSLSKPGWSPGTVFRVFCSCTNVDRAKKPVPARGFYLPLGQTRRTKEIPLLTGPGFK